MANKKVLCLSAEKFTDHHLRFSGRQLQLTGALKQNSASLFLELTLDIFKRPTRGQPGSAGKPWTTTSEIQYV